MMAARKMPPRDPVTKRFVSPAAVAATEPPAPEPSPPYEPAHADETPVAADATTVTVTAAPEGGGVITVEDRAALLQRIPPWVRGALYVAVAIGSVLVAYAVSKHVIGADEVVLWLGITSALGIVAAGNLRV